MDPEREAIKLLEALHWEENKPKFSSSRALRKKKKAQRVNKRIGRKRQS